MILGLVGCGAPVATQVETVDERDAGSAPVRDAGFVEPDGGETTIDASIARDAGLARDAGSLDAVVVETTLAGTSLEGITVEWPEDVTLCDP